MRAVVKQPEEIVSLTYFFQVKGAVPPEPAVT